MDGDCPAESAPTEVDADSNPDDLLNLGDLDYFTLGGDPPALGRARSRSRSPERPVILPLLRRSERFAGCGTRDTTL